MTKVYKRNSVKNLRRKLRKGLPNAEHLHWQKLRSRQVGGFKFKRQYSIGNYVVDFYCAENKLAIEVDGDSHFGIEAEKYDNSRQKYIENFGITFLRFTNIDVYQNMEGVLDKIFEELTSP